MLERDNAYAQRCRCIHIAATPRPAVCVRLGGASLGDRAVQRHRFFSSMDWEKLIDRNIPAPIRFSVRDGPDDDVEVMSLSQGVMQQAASSSA